MSGAFKSARLGAGADVFRSPLLQVLQQFLVRYHGQALDACCKRCFAGARHWTAGIPGMSVRSGRVRDDGVSACRNDCRKRRGGATA